MSGLRVAWTLIEFLVAFDMAEDDVEQEEEEAELERQIRTIEARRTMEKELMLPTQVVMPVLMKLKRVRPRPGDVLGMIEGDRLFSCTTRQDVNWILIWTEFE